MSGWRQRLRERAHALKRETLALALACRHPRTPWLAKALALAAVAYALSPIDLIPDFIPVLGLLDELLLLPALLALAISLVPPDVMADCRARAATGEGAPSRRQRLWGGAFVVALWIAVAALAGWWGWRHVR